MTDTFADGAADGAFGDASFLQVQPELRRGNTYGVGVGEQIRQHLRKCGGPVVDVTPALDEPQQATRLIRGRARESELRFVEWTGGVHGVANRKRILQ